MGYQSVVFEGGDQVGKGDASNSFANHLLNEGISVNHIAFPIYATPIGSTIRRFLKEGIGDVKSFDKITGTRKEIEIRMMIFALNRLEALESILRHSKDLDGIFLLDRSPYSNALTIAYALGGLKNVTNDDVKELAKLGWDIEQLLINTLNLDQCVIQLSVDNGDGGWQVERNDSDLHESKDVQEVADFVYTQFSKYVDDGWQQIFTKKEGKWRSRDDIYTDIRKFVDTRLDLKKGEGISKTLDVVDIAMDIYGVDVSGMVERYYNAISTCDKSAMYEEAFNISNYVNKSSTEIRFENEQVIKNFRDILDIYPEILDLFEYYLGKSFVENLKVCIYG